MIIFFIVKDTITNNGTTEYPEELEYVGEQYSLTTGTNDYNGEAKKTVDIELMEDESILINQNVSFNFVKK